MFVWREDMVRSEEMEAVDQTKKNILHRLFVYMDKEKEKATLEGFIKVCDKFLRNIWGKVWRNQLLLSSLPEERAKWVRLAEKEGFRWHNEENVDERYVALFAHVDFDARGWVREEIGEKWGILLLSRKQYDFLTNQFFYHLKDVFDKSEYEYFVFRKKLSGFIRHELKKGELYVKNEKGQSIEKVSVTSFLAEGRSVGDFFDAYAVNRPSSKSKKKKKSKSYGKFYGKVIRDSFIPEFLFEQINIALKKNSGTTLSYSEFRSLQMTPNIYALVEKRYKSYLKQFSLDSLKNIKEYAEKPIEEQYALYLEEIEQEQKRQNQEKEEREKQILHIFGDEYQYGGYEGTRYVLHIGDTNTGKTHQALETLKKHKKGIYLAPLRLLALEVYEKLNKEGIPCILRTGEETKEVVGANHESCTIEMFNERIFYDIVVIDEAQLIADKERGFAWYRAIAKAQAKEVHIIGNPSMEQLVLKLLGDADVEVIEYERQTPLVVQKKAFHIRDVQRGDALIAFSRKRVLQIAAKVERDGQKVSVIYGNMPPETRQRQMVEFVTGETDVVVATDAIGMGLNLPIRRIVFMDDQKFDGIRMRELTVQEVKQIAGRAGRRGIYEEGIVVFPQSKSRMKNKLFSNEKQVRMFTIAPTRKVIERFSEYSKDLGMFFRFWNKFENPKGTVKSSLAEEQQLYQLIRGSSVEHVFSMEDLYSYLQMPFSSHEPKLAMQWKEAMHALAERMDIKEPIVKEDSLEQLELSYKSVELFLMFLYRLDKQTEAYYWERVKRDIALSIDIWLKTQMKDFTKKCNRCQKKLPWDYGHGICEDCYYSHFGEQT